MISLFQCFNDNESDEVYNSLIRSSNTTTESNNSNSNSNSINNRRNLKIYIEISIGSVDFDVLIDRKGIKFADVINEALNVYIANTNTTRKNIVIKGIILNDSKNIININNISNDVVTINARKFRILFEYRYTISVFTTNAMKSIFKFLHQSPHQLTQLLKCSKTMNMLLDTDEYWKHIDLNDSFCRVNDKTWITLRNEHGLPYKNLLRIRHTNMYSCRLKVFYGNLRQAKQSTFSSFSCLELPEDYGIILKKNLVLMVGQGSNTLCQQMHFYVSNAIPISGKSQVVVQHTLFRGGELVDMDYRNGNIVQIESIPRQENRWLLRRSGDGRLTFIQVDHVDNSHPKNNEAIIFQKNSILDRVNSFIVVIEYNQNAEDGKVELFLESVYKNYISIWRSSQLSSLEKCSPILIMIGIHLLTITSSSLLFTLSIIRRSKIIIDFVFRSVR